MDVTNLSKNATALSAVLLLKVDVCTTLEKLFVMLVNHPVCSTVYAVPFFAIIATTSSLA